MAYRMSASRKSLSSSIGRAIDQLEHQQALTPLRDWALPTLTPPIEAGSDAMPIAIAAPSLAVQAGASSLPNFVGAPTELDADDRTFTPSGSFTSQPSTRRWVSRLVLGKAVTQNLLPHGISMRAKKTVILCIRRKTRRSVILASGYGGGRHRSPKPNENSNLWC